MEKYTVKVFHILQNGKQAQQGTAPFKERIPQQHSNRRQDTATNNTNHKQNKKVKKPRQTLVGIERATPKGRRCWGSLKHKAHTQTKRNRTTNISL